MKQKAQFIACSLFCLVALSLGLTANSLAQSSKSESAPSSGQEEKQVLQMLLSEVHQLRLAMQQANVNAYRTQIILERMRMQQTRVDKLAHDLAELQMQTNESASNRPRMEERLKELEASANQEADPVRRANLISEFKDLKFTLDQRNTWEQQQRERESQLNRTLQTEQAKLADFSEQLDGVLRDLEKLLLPDKAAPAPRRN